MQANTNVPIQQANSMPGQAFEAQMPGQGGFAANIDYQGLLLHLLERAWIILIAAVLGGLGASYYAETTYVPMYQAYTKLYLTGSDLSIAIGDLTYGSSAMADYLAIFDTWHVHELVNERLGLDYSYATLASKISVTNPSNTHILKITATSTDPQEAMNLANTYAQVAREYIVSRMNATEPSIFEQARLPVSPINSSNTRTVLIGFAGAALLVGGFLALLFILDDRLRTADDLTRRCHMTTLGMMPELNGKSQRKPYNVAAVYGKKDHYHRRGHTSGGKDSAVKQEESANA